MVERKKTLNLNKSQWLFLVTLKGGMYYIIPELAVYTTYIPLIVLAFWGVICYLPPFRGTRNNHWKSKLFDMCLTNTTSFMIMPNTPEVEPWKSSPENAWNLPSILRWSIPHPYHPCMVYLLTFSWFLWYMEVNIPVPWILWVKLWRGPELSGSHPWPLPQQPRPTQLNRYDDGSFFF